MNSFFFKNLISSTSNNKNEEDEQADFQRLIELCNSYGLNEQQTKQLINQFKKGSYKSGTNSLNQSMVSEQQDMSMSQNGDISQRNYQYSQNYSLEPSRTFHQQKNANYYQESQKQHESQSSNRYYGYENEIQEKNEQSYNEMTFNQQNNSLMLNSHRFHDGQNHFNVDSRGNILKHELMVQHKINQRPIESNLIEDKPLERINSRKQTLLQKRLSHQQNLSNINSQVNNSEPTRNFKQSISTKSFSQQHDKNSGFDFSKQQSAKQPRASQQTSKYSQNSIQSHEIENQPINGLNPEYVKALIRNFQLLEAQNQSLKEENSTLQNKTQILTRQYDLTKRENEKIKCQLSDLKDKQKFSTNQTAKFEALYEAEKQKNHMFLNMKQKDSELIKGLKDSLLQLTELIKEKDSQNNQLQQRLFSLYEKIQNQSSTKYNCNQMGNQFNQTGVSTQAYFDKSFSKKSLTISESEKSLKPPGQDESRDRNANYVRKQLSEIMGKNINLPQNNRLAGQESKQMIRQLSASRLNPSSSNDQVSYKKQSVNSQQNKEQGDSKQNVFAPLQVEPAIKRHTNQNGKSSEQDKKRPSSRVDIKKYKGMIEELRNSYSHVGSGNQIVR